jgi:hypothetical protein
LSDLEVLFRGNLQFVFRTIHLLGISETQGVDKSESENAEKLLRLLTPVVKLFTAKQAMTVASEAIECLGGTGYMEVGVPFSFFFTLLPLFLLNLLHLKDSHMPILLRDAQVLPIWEGTTTVLSLDVLRVLVRTPESFTAFHEDIKRRLSTKNSSTASPVVVQLKQIINEAATKTLSFTKKFSEAASSSSSEQLEAIEANAREFAMDLGKIYAGTLLVEHASWSDSVIDVEVALRWALLQGLIHPSLHPSPSLEANRKLDRIIGMDVDPKTEQPRGVGDTDPWGKIRARF